MLHIGSPEHPLNATFGGLFGGGDPLAEVASSVDQALGRILEAAGPEATVVAFSQEAMVPNNTDVTSTLFVPELLYRWSFPGKMAMCGALPGDESRPGPPITHLHSFGWARKCWALKHDPNPIRRSLRRVLPVEIGRLMERVLGAPEGVGYIKDYEPWFQPVMWYRDHWPRMRAFALPSYSDGLVRINLIGREPDGKVAPEEYEAVCSELEAEFLGLVDARTGEPVVTGVLRTEAAQGGDKCPDADLIVKWAARPTDCVVSRSLGRIGPAPMARSGGHEPTGFAILAGPAVAAAGRVAETGLVIDLAPTLLHLAGAPIPGRLAGRSLID